MQNITPTKEQHTTDKKQKKKTNGQPQSIYTEYIAHNQKKNKIHHSEPIKK